MPGSRVDPHAQARAQRLAAVRAQIGTLDPELDRDRMRALALEGADLVDQAEDPVLWAMFRSIYAWRSEQVDPEGAIAAYRDQLQVWEPDAHRDAWLDCHRNLAHLLLQQPGAGSTHREQAREHLECVVQAIPEEAGMLAMLYEVRVLGDPWENWNRQQALLRQYAALLDPDAEPARWARAMHDRARAAHDEPGANFDQAVENQLALLQETLQRLPPGNLAAEAGTRCLLSRAHTDRARGQRADNLQAARQQARQALEAGIKLDDAHLQVQALLALASVLTQPDSHNTEQLEKAQDLCTRAQALLATRPERGLLATVHAYRVNICLLQLKAGSLEVADALAMHGDRSASLLSGTEDSEHRCTVLHTVAEGLMLAGDHERAAGFLRRTLHEARTSLEQARTQRGRMARIWALRDSAARLAHCLLHLGQTMQALVELDRGKALFWQMDAPEWAPADLAALIPADGALLVANFCCDPGAVVIVSQQGLDTVWLPGFGRTRLMELQRGPELARNPNHGELGGWLRAYYEQSEHPQAWRQAVDDMGQTLHQELWRPLQHGLRELGVEPSAELVWLHQGGSSGLPLQAAWCEGPDGQRRWLVDEYVIRYAPSISALLAPRPPRRQPGDATLVADPAGNLPFSRLECAWAARLLPAPTRLLQHEQATASALLDAARAADILHLATHAHFEPADPLQSQLQLAGGAAMRIPELLQAVAAHPPKLLVLSACETGRTQVTSLPDEALGFPAPFLYAGTRCVVSTLWPVDDVASALLMQRFYQELHTNRNPPAQALCRAQRWLRSATARELMALLRQARQELEPPLAAQAAAQRNRLRALPLESHPYAAPWYWAAFTISGANDP